MKEEILKWTREKSKDVTSADIPAPKEVFILLYRNFLKTISSVSGAIKSTDIIINTLFSKSYSNDNLLFAIS